MPDRRATKNDSLFLVVRVVDRDGPSNRSEGITMSPSFLKEITQWMILLS